LATLEALPDNPAEAGFFPLPEGYSLEPEPFTDAQLAELKGLCQIRVPAAAARRLDRHMDQ